MTFFPKSNAKTLDGIRTRVQNRNLNSIKYPWNVVAIDTETDNGLIFLISDNNGNYLDLDDITFENIANWLLRYEGNWVFGWNFQYDADCILRLLPKEILKSYKWKKELNFQYKEYKIHYFDKKKLTISKGNHSVSVYDIMQYYDQKKLAIAYEKNIKKPLDQEYLQIKGQRGVFSKYYYCRHKRQIRKYCKQDCILTKELANHWIGTFKHVFGFFPKNWISAGYLAEKVLINNRVEIPFFHESPYEVQELARSCFYGGRFELVKRGYIGQCHIYDINSAYPYSLTQIPDILDGKWFFSKEINPKLKLGFFYILADIADTVKIAPFPFRKKNGTICYPSGKFKTFVTLQELLMVQNDPKIKYKILESYQFIPNKNCKYPFKEFIITQYKRRLKLKKEKNPLQQAIKIVLNSIYGKTAQRTNNVMGNMFNPIIASAITGFTRAQLYRFVKENNLDNEIVAFATDSVACQKRIHGLNSEKLGEMKYDKYGLNTTFLSNGFYTLDGKVWKNRGVGFDNERKLEIEHVDSQVDESGNFFIKLETTRTTHIKSGILYNKLHKVGKIEKYWKKIGLNSDRKRLWDSDLESLNDGKCCDSVPIPADLVGDLIGKEEIEWKDELYDPESDL